MRNTLMYSMLTSWYRIHENISNVWLSCQSERCLFSSPTSVCVVQEDELVPVVVVEEGQEGPTDRRPELQGELALALGGETRRDEGDVQRAAEGRQRVDRTLVVQAEDGEDTAGVLGADCGRKQEHKN